MKGRLLGMAARGSLARAWMRRSPLWVFVAAGLGLLRWLSNRTKKTKN